MPGRAQRCLPARDTAHKLQGTRSFAARYHRSGRPSFLEDRLVAFEDDVEAAGFRLGDERFGLALILEAREVRLESAARVVAKLDAREAGGLGAVYDRRRSRSVTPVTEDGLEPTERLRLDALERDGEPFAASLALEIDSNIKSVDAANDDPEAVAALDDVRVHEAARGHLSAERQGLLVGLPPPEDCLEPADEFQSSASLLGSPETGCRARQAQRRHRSCEPAGQASQHQETCDPHGAQS